MLKGLEVSEVLYSSLLVDYNKLRLDAEYFRKEYMGFYNQIVKYGFNKIGDFAFVTDGIHASIEFSIDSKINLISAKSPKENYFDLSSNHHISHSQHKLNPRTELKKNDVVISTVGTIGNCSVVENNILPANSDRHVGIVRLKNKIRPYFLSTFLLTKYGRFQTFRESTGNVQLNLFIYKIKEILVPKVSEHFQKNIEILCIEAHQSKEKANKIYTQAEELLLAEVGLQDFNPSIEKVNIKSFADSFGTSGRLDAEYYQPKYEGYEKIVKEKQFTYIKDEYIHIDKKAKRTKSKYNYIEISDVNTSDGSNISNELNVEDLPANAKNIVQKGDILISKVRPYRGAVTIINSGGSDIIASGAFTVLRKNPKSIFNNEVLKVLLRTNVYKDWLLQFNVGTSYPVIKNDDILNLPIPYVEESKQQQIAALAEQSFTLKAQSEHLLEIAKRAVEIAIEEGEATAMVYIKKEAACYE